MRGLLGAFLGVVALSASAAPLFGNSVVSNDLGFINTQDPSAFYCLQYFGTDRREMPDKRKDELFADGVHNFEAWFKDGTAIGIWVHPDVGENARQVALQVTGPLGRLPPFMSERLGHVVIHHGDETAFAEDEGRFFVLYDGNMARRIATHDLEETVFHEAVHATLDIPLARSDAWQRAQQNDHGFVTRYAQANPYKEDLAETALFAYAHFQHPDRLPADVTARLVAEVPNRLPVLEQLFGADQQMQSTVDNLQGCDG